MVAALSQQMKSLHTILSWTFSFGSNAALAHSCFVIDLLTKQPITQDDLNEDDKRWLRNGCVQPLPQKDRAGRGVMVMLPKHESTTDDDLHLSKSHVSCVFSWFPSVLR